MPAASNSASACGGASCSTTSVSMRPGSRTGKGATLTLSRVPRALQAEDVLMRTDGMPHYGAILTPNALPMYKDETDAMGRSTKRRRDKDRKDPIKSKMPLPPIDAPVWDIDLFDSETSNIQALKTAGKIVICYFSAGTREDWRDDAKDFPAADGSRILVLFADAAVDES